MKPLIRIKFSPEAEEVYNYLKEKSNAKTERMILNAIDNKLELIKSNAHYGDSIAKNLIPREYKIKYDVTLLLRVELPCFWRMLYTLKKEETEIEIIAFVLDIMDHKEYNKKFKYRNK